MAIDKTETIKLRAEFKNDSGTLTDPTTPVELVVRNNAGSTTVSNVTRLSEGIFEEEYEVTESGLHYYTFTSSDGGVEQGAFSAKTLKTA